MGESKGKRKRKARPTISKSPGKKAPRRAVPHRREISDAILVAAAMGPAQLLAVLLKTVLKDRITSDEIQTICDCFYHD